ncbi:MAG TPA: DNA polymerase III subunit gamma/tau, partial [Pasteurellaceae bacterium]|nr:DNA polymerase III subunit gamma/tau [Pasteurellaceae bacterium]
MSYQVLARKWRPKNFVEVVGQEYILTALANGLKQNRLHHAYLFSGTRGVGKTSIARLFAKGLNCINGVTAEPCGHCAHCRTIEEGNFIDLIEIDAASRTKVEDTRELLDNVQYKPVQGRYKVYLIDEVHMLSRHSFNALLKTLEEPPEYVKFLLATTDPQKLPITILSRCMQFHLKALEQNQISHHLAHILAQEKIPYEAAALDKIAKAAQGSIRDSLSLTDQAIAMSNANITLDIVSKMLGLLDDNQPIEIIYALHQGNGESLMKAVQAAADKGADWDEILLEVGETLHRIAMQQLLPSSINEESQIGFLAKHITPEDLQFFYQTILIGRKELAFAPSRRIGVEMTLLRALAFHPKLVSAKFDEQSSTPQNEDKLVEIPVFSQAIQAQYKAQTAMPSVAQTEDRPSASTQSNTSAFNALEQLKKLRSNVANEKKNLNLTEDAPLPPQTTVLPVVSARPNIKKSDLLDRFVNLASQSSGENTAEQSAVENSEENEHEDDANLAETYRWEWINPAMDQEETGIRPSDIKLAILQEKTPELIARVIELAEQADEWTKTIGQLELENLKLIKQIALNSVILEQTEDRIKLGLRSAQTHLNKENAVEV